MSALSSAFVTTYANSYRAPPRKSAVYEAHQSESLKALIFTSHYWRSGWEWEQDEYVEERRGNTQAGAKERKKYLWEELSTAKNYLDYTMEEEAKKHGAQSSREFTPSSTQELLVDAPPSSSSPSSSTTAAAAAPSSSLAATQPAAVSSSPATTQSAAVSSAAAPAPSAQSNYPLRGGGAIATHRSTTRSTKARATMPNQWSNNIKQHLKK